MVLLFLLSGFNLQHFLLKSKIRQPKRAFPIVVNVVPFFSCLPDDDVVVRTI